MEDNKKDEERVKAFMKAFADMGSMLGEKVEQMKNAMSEQDAKNFAEIWKQEDGDKKFREFRQSVNRLNDKLKKL